MEFGTRNEVDWWNFCGLEAGELIEYTNNSTFGVSLPQEALQLLKHFKNLTHFHNHPHADVGHNDTDLSMPVRTGLDESIITLGIIGEKHVFYMHREQQKWPSAEMASRYFVNLISNRNPETDPVYLEVFMNDTIEGGYFTNAALSRFAKDFGYVFQIVDSPAA